MNIRYPIYEGVYRILTYGSSGHRQGDFREDTLGVREFREKGGTSLQGT